MHFKLFLQRPDVKEHIANMELEKVYNILTFWERRLFTHFLQNKAINVPDYFNESIPAYAFSNPAIVASPIKLPERIAINDSVIEIGAGAFNNNKDLKYVQLPAALSKVDTSAFEGCENIVRFEYPGTIAELNNKFQQFWQDMGDMLFYCADGYCSVDENGEIKDIYYAKPIN